MTLPAITTATPSEKNAALCMTLVCTNEECALPYMFRKAKVELGLTPTDCPTCGHPFAEPRPTTPEDLL